MWSFGNRTGRLCLVIAGRKRVRLVIIAHVDAWGNTSRTGTRYRIDELYRHEEATRAALKAAQREWLERMRREIEGLPFEGNHESTYHPTTISGIDPSGRKAVRKPHVVHVLSRPAVDPLRQEQAMAERLRAGRAARPIPWPGKSTARRYGVRSDRGPGGDGHLPKTRGDRDAKRVWDERYRCFRMETQAAGFTWLLKSPHAEGPYLWVLGNPRRFAEPIFYRGKQGLFDVPEAMIADQPFV